MKKIIDVKDLYTQFGANVVHAGLNFHINEGEIYRFFTKPWDPIELKLSIRLGIEKFDLENERKILLSVVQQQRDELVRIEEECPGISKVKRDTADAILVDEMSEEQMAEIKKWWVNN